MYEYILKRVKGSPVLVPVKEFEKTSLTTPLDIYEFFKSEYYMSERIEEYIYLLCFNSKYDGIGVFEISHGGMNLAYCDMKSIFSRALLCAASAIVIIHNHPSGNPQPSVEDEGVFERLKKCGNMLSIETPDSIIIGNGAYYSFAENA